MTINQFSWLTAVTKDEYLVGAQTLARSLQTVKSQFKLIVMVTPSVSESVIREMDKETNVVIHFIDQYRLPEGVVTNYAFERFAEAWNKMRGWEIEGYEILCWLDADMLILHNMDEIFQLLGPDRRLGAANACICNPNKIKTYPEYWNPQNCRYSSQPEIDFTTRVCDSPRRYFNAGLLLFRPGRDELAKMESYMKSTADLSSYKFAEQDFLNEFYRLQWVELPVVYNALKTLAKTHTQLWDLKQVKNIHYILDKPWNADMSKLSSSEDTYYQINRLWWLMFLRLNDKELLEIFD